MLKILWIYSELKIGLSLINIYYIYNRSGFTSNNDKKKFKKNYVRPSSKGNVLLSSLDMVKVLPKESEREIQMRLDFEAAKLRSVQAEEIFQGDGGKLKKHR